MFLLLLQAFKSVYYRYRAQKKLIDSYKLCEEGAKLQLQKGQLNCGVELALLLLEVCCLLSTCLCGLNSRVAEAHQDDTTTVNLWAALPSGLHH